MALNNLGLGFVFTGKDISATSTMNKVDRTYKRLDNTTAKSTANLSQGFGMMRTTGLVIGAAGALAMRGMTQAADASGKFEQSIAKVGAISQATTSELSKLEAAAIQAGIKTQFSPQEAAEGLGDLAVQGFNATDSIRLLNSALSLAAGGQIEVAEAARTTSAAVKIFNLDLDGASLAADQLLKISNVTALSAKDLELALGTVGRGATVAKQSIEEMLPSIGLVKNTGVDASVAASSVSSALVFMAKSASKFDKLGISLTDSTGKFRPFLDVVMDAKGALSGIDDEAKRAAKATELFGRFGLTAFAAISNQLQNGIKDTTGQIIKGEEAVRFLRESMAGAEGTAEKFRQKLLNTFEGQKTLLRGSLDTLKIILGDAFAKGLRPIVEQTIKVVNNLIARLQAIPDETKELIARIAMITAMVTTFAGAGLALIGVLGAAKAAIGVLGLSFGAVVQFLLPIAAAIVVVIGAFKFFQFAYRENLGGFRDFIEPITAKVVLFFRALRQLFTKGFLTGAVLADLQKVENEGIVKLLGAVIRLGFRIKRFAEGFRTGFVAVLKAMGPTFQDVVAAFTRFGAAVGFTGKLLDKTSAGPSKRFLQAGEKVGAFFGNLIDILMQGVSAYANAYAAGIEVFQAGWTVLGPMFSDLQDNLQGLWDDMMDFAKALGFGGAEGASFADVLEGVGKVVGGVATAMAGSFGVFLHVMIAVTRAVMQIMTRLVTGMTNAANAINNIWEGIGAAIGIVVDGIKAAIDAMIDRLASVAEALPKAIRPAIVDDFIDSRRSTATPIGVNTNRPSLAGSTIPFDGIQPLSFGGQSANNRGSSDEDKDQLIAAIAAAVRQGMSSTKITMMADSEKIATSVRKGQRSIDAGTFGGTPGIGDE